MSEQKTKEKKSGKVVLIVFAAIIGCIALVYVGGFAFFQSHFMMHTSIDGEDVSLKSLSDAQEILEAQNNNYKMTIIEKGGETEVLSFEGCDLVVKVTDDMKDIVKQQDQKLWFMMFWKDSKLSAHYKVDYNEENVITALKELDFMKNQKAPVDACVSYTPGQGFSISKEQGGTAIDDEALLSTIHDEAQKLARAIDLEALNCYKLPKVYSDDESLQKTLDVYKKYDNVTFIYEFGANQEIVEEDELFSWIKVTKNYKVKIDENAITKYVEGLAKKYDTVDTDRQFKTSNHYTITTHGKYYGYKLNVEEETAALIESINAAQGFDREPIYSQTGKDRGSMNDIGDTYIEVSIKNQHVYCYKDGKMIFDTDCVTGNPNGHSTRTGLFYIKYMASPAVLTGQDYESHVRYWMPFDGGIGLHDADWRGRFGGDIYTYNGSHGCVNLPIPSAQYIYQTYTSGTPVIVYTE